MPVVLLNERPTSHTPEACDYGAPMVTPLVPPDPGVVAGAALDHLRAALTQLRPLSEQPFAAPFDAHSAEESAAVVADL